MTANEEDLLTVKLRSPLDITTSIPYLLGFAPAESVVMVFFREADRRLVVTGRVDYPRVPAGEGSVLARCSHVYRSAAAAGATAVHLAIYPPLDRSLSETDSLCRGLCEAADSVGLTAWSCGAVACGSWFDFFTGDIEGVPIDGTGDEVACSFIAHGRSYLADRQSLESCVIGPATELAAAVSKCIDGYEQFEPVPHLGTPGERRRIEDAMFKFLTERTPARMQTPPESAPHVPILTGWMLALADRRVREPLLRRMAMATGKGASEHPIDVWRDGAIQRMSWMARNSPLELGAPVAASLAAFSWQIGNGALAMIAAQHALNCDPSNVLAGLIQEAVSRGVHPDIWVGMLESLTLSELRSGHASAPVRSHPKRT